MIFFGFFGHLLISRLLFFFFFFPFYFDDLWQLGFLLLLLLRAAAVDTILMSPFYGCLYIPLDKECFALYAPVWSWLKLFLDFLFLSSYVWPSEVDERRF